MALLQFDNAPQQQQSGGLLNNMDPEMRQMVGMMLMRTMMGGRRRGGGGNNALQMLMQMQQQESQAKRYAQSDAIEQEKLNLARQQFGMQQQIHNQELQEKQQTQAGNQQLADMVSGGGQMPPAPQAASDASQAASDMPEAQAMPQVNVNPQNMVASNAPVMTPNMQQQPQKPQVQQGDSSQGSPDILAAYAPDQQKKQQDEMNRRKMSATLLRAGKTKEGIDYLTPPVTEMDKKLAEKDAATLEESRKQASAGDAILNLVPQYRKILDGTSDMVVGPIASTFGINEIISKNVQNLNNIGNRITSISKPLQNTSNQNFSNADLQFLIKSNVGTMQDKDVQYDALGRIESDAKRLKVRSQFLENYLQSKGTLSGADEAFTKASSHYESMANEAIQQGRDPKAVKQMLQKMRGF